MRWKPRPGLTPEEVRPILVARFHEVMHDLNCDCQNANPAAAMILLGIADWSITELFEAWHAWWLGND